MKAKKGCKPSFFNLDSENDFGCTPCFCYGHSSVCQSAPGYSQVVIENNFARGAERWTAQEANGRSISMNFNGITQAIGVSAPGRDPVYFVAPDRYLGDMRTSYNRDLQFKLRLGESAPAPTVEDVVLEGAGIRITQTIFGQRNPLPAISVEWSQEYKFRLHEDADYGWQPRLTAREFMSVLSNLTAVKIRGTYTPEGVGFLDDVQLHTARREAAGRPANWIEMCTCPDGYVGQFCESCAPGFRHEPAHGGRFARCVPCNCNGHADICDADTGRCICQHNTAGENCDRCARGYYGNALAGTSSDCQPCPCPNQGACVELMDETVVCLECPKGYGGPRCDICSDGFFGDPEGRFGRVVDCEPCDCNTNVDPNGIGNCNRTSGECLKCIYNTGGSHCDQCLPGFFGDALAIPKGDCKPCQCYRPGTQVIEGGPMACDQLTGQCRCKPYVTGTNCNTCEDGYFNIVSGDGCQPCNCDPIGSINGTCSIVSGQCQCRPGVTGLRCDVCEQNKYGFSSTGCKSCDCDPIGSVELQCDPFGQCPCYDNVEGQRCDQCKENKFDRQRGCIDCPECYNLVQDAVNAHRKKLSKLVELLSNITDTPTVIDDVDFERKLNEVQERVDQLWTDAKSGAGSGDKTLLERLEDLKKRLQAVSDMHKQVHDMTGKASDSTEQGERNATLAEDAIESAQEALKNALEYLQTEGAEALTEAIQRSEQYGQQSDQMSDIARQARQLAQDQEDEATSIRNIAQQAVNTSQQAYEIAKNAINEQKNTRLDRTKILATEARERATAVHEEALGIYRDVYGLNVPDLDTRKVRAESEKAAEDARRIKADAEALLAEHGELLSELAEQSAAVQDLLKRGVEQQQVADELLADADAANADAEEAVRLGDKTLAEAQNTLTTLQEFDKDEADEIRQGADDTKKLAEQVRDEADRLASRVADTGSRVKDLEDRAAADETLTTEAKQKVGQAKSNAAEATKKVEKALSEVDDILKELQDVTDIDEDQLNNLEKKLADAERDFQAANLDQRMDELKAMRLQQMQWMKDYTEEVARLRAEVNNVEDIRNSLPDGCWKRVKLEP
ncbi:hypothetical protein B566_EDAN016517 [Ephemera danica]|nr:hypothetical protein B566_EDAN016517 [Ephemera danica]